MAVCVIRLITKLRHCAGECSYTNCKFFYFCFVFILHYYLKRPTFTVPDHLDSILRCRTLVLYNKVLKNNPRSPPPSLLLD